MSSNFALGFLAVWGLVLLIFALWAAWQRLMPQFAARGIVATRLGQSPSWFRLPSNDQGFVKRTYGRELLKQLRLQSSDVQEARRAAEDADRGKSPATGRLLVRADDLAVAYTRFQVALHMYGIDAPHYNAFVHERSDTDKPAA